MSEERLMRKVGKTVIFVGRVGAGFSAGESAVSVLGLVLAGAQ